MPRRSVNQRIAMIFYDSPRWPKEATWSLTRVAGGGAELRIDEPVRFTTDLIVHSKRAATGHKDRLRRSAKSLPNALA